MTFDRTVLWRLTFLLSSGALAAACASGPGPSARRNLRLDTETTTRLRHAATAAQAASRLAPTATRTMASNIGQLVPLLLTVLESDNAVEDFEARLEACAQQTELRVNSSSFGNRAPTRQECAEKAGVDKCGEPITRAMLLGQQKHALALACAREVLSQSWPQPFSIEQRYRYYPHAQMVETVSRAEEERLIAQNCTGELWRTIKPDIVLHPDGNLLRSLLILDFKFPCPDTNSPQWTRYGERSAYKGFDQKQLYKEALGGEVLLISPKTGIVP